VVNSVRIIAQQKDDCVWVRRLLVDLVYPQLYCTNLDLTTDVVQQNKSFFLLKLLRMSAWKPVNAILNFTLDASGVIVLQKDIVLINKIFEVLLVYN